MNQIHNPIIPFNGPIPGGMHPGAIVRVQGSAPAFSTKFAINLLSGVAGDIALHLAVDFHRNHVIRNSVQHRNWGHEEHHGHLPIRPGQSFDILILCESHQYKIAINGGHFAEFHHRIPFNCVTNLAIDGQVAVSAIYFEGSGAYNVGGFAPTAHAMHIPPVSGTFPAGIGYPQVPGAVPYAPGAVPHLPGTVPHLPGAAAPYPGQAYPYPGHPHAPDGAHYPTQPGYPPGHYTKEQSTIYPHSPTYHKKTGLLDKAGLAVAGMLGGSALMGGSKYNKLAPLVGGGLGATVAGAAMSGHLLNPKKAMKKQSKMQKKALKYGLPVAGAGLAAYGLHKGMHKLHHHGHHHGRSSSSSSSSSSD